MDSKQKEKLYLELSGILINLEEGSISEAREQLEWLVNRLKYDKL